MGPARNYRFHYHAIIIVRVNINSCSLIFKIPFHGTLNSFPWNNIAFVHRQEIVPIGYRRGGVAQLDTIST